MLPWTKVVKVRLECFVFFFNWGMNFESKLAKAVHVYSYMLPGTKVVKVLELQVPVLGPAVQAGQGTARIF